MSVSTVNARFMKVLLPLVVLCFLVISGVTYYLASEMLTGNMVMVSRCIGKEAALRMQLLVADIHLPLKVASANHAILTAEEPEALAYLNDVRKASPLIAQTFFIRPDGRTLRADGVHLDRSSRAYVKKVIDTKQPYISQPFIGETTKTMQTMVLQPILEDGQLRGILMASIYLSDLTQQALQGEIFPDGRVYITDGDGFVAGCSDDPSIVGVLADLVADPKLAEALHQAIKSQEQTFTNCRAPDGQEQFAMVTPFELSGNRWTIISSYPLAKVTAPARRLLRISAVVFLLILIVAALIIRFFARSISEPLQNIAHEFQKLHGDSRAVADDGNDAEDEIGILAEGVARMRAIHDQRQHFEQKATSDELTGLLNRFGFKRQVRAAVAEHAGHAAVLAFADLDHLKHINDQVGHAAGDDAISTAARLLRQGFGEKAIIGRVGGDEFVVFSCKGDGEPGTVERTRRLAADYNEDSGKPYYVELSIGVTEFVCHPDTDISRLMKTADVCLYEAKQRRRQTSIRE